MSGESREYEDLDDEAAYELLQTTQASTLRARIATIFARLRRTRGELSRVRADFLDAVGVNADEYAKARGDFGRIHACRSYGSQRGKERLNVRT